MRWSIEHLRLLFLSQHSFFFVEVACLCEYWQRLFTDLENNVSFFSEHTRLGVWTLDGNPHHQNLLQFALKESKFTDTTVVLVVSMTNPWNIMDQLQNWASLLQDHIDKLTLTAERTKTLQNESESS